MSVSEALKTLSRRECLSEEAARRVTGALLDGGVPELEEGALLALLDRRRDCADELIGSARALSARAFQLRVPTGPARPIVLSSCTGIAGGPNLLALLALILQRLKLPVLVHGVLSASRRIVAAQILRELGIAPRVTLAQAQQELDAGRVTFVPTAVLCPGLAHLLALRGRIGFGAFAERMTCLLDPFAGSSLVVIAAADAEERALLRSVLRDRPGSYLLLGTTHGEAFADAQCRPSMELLGAGRCELLFDAEAMPQRHAMRIPETGEPRATAAWIHGVLGGEHPMPMPIANQVACCLYGAGYTFDMNQAKAIAAVQTRSLLAA